VEGVKVIIPVSNRMALMVNLQLQQGAWLLGSEIFLKCHAFIFILVLNF
jgi:hypothetical protein